MPNYFNVKNNTYFINRFLPLLPLVPLLLLRSKGEPSTISTAMTSAPDFSSNDIANENNTYNMAEAHSLMHSIGSIFNGSNALDILSSVEPYVNANHQQLISAVKGFSRSLESLKSYRSNPVSTNAVMHSSDSLNMIRALSTNFNKDIKNSIDPILNILSTVKGIQSSAPAIQQMLSPDGLTNILSNFSSMFSNDSASFMSNESAADNNTGSMDIAEIIKLITTLNAAKAEPLFNSESSDLTDTKLLEAMTEDDSDYQPEDIQVDETSDNGSLIDMAEKLKEMIDKK